MKKIYLASTFIAGLLLASAAQADLKCPKKSELVYICGTEETGLMVDEAILCVNKKGQYQLTVAGEGLEAPAMPVKRTERTGATTYSGSEEGVSLSLSVGGRPMKNENGAFYRTGNLKLQIDDLATASKLKCYVNSLNNH